MSKVTFSKISDGYSPKEVDAYIDMLEQELTKAVLLDDEKSAKLTEIENKLSGLTIENSRLKEDSKRFDLEISKVYEERDALQKQLGNNAQSGRDFPQTPVENLDSLIEAVLSLARANERLAGNKAKDKTAYYHSPSHVDEIVNSVLSEAEESSPKLSY